MECDCGPPDLWEENRGGWALYVAWGTQSRMGPSGFAGFDYGSILQCADRFGNGASDEDFGLLRLIEAWLLKRQADRNREAMEGASRGRR